MKDTQTDDFTQPPPAVGKTLCQVSV